VASRPLAQNCTDSAGPSRHSGCPPPPSIILNDLVTQTAVTPGLRSIMTPPGLWWPGGMLARLASGWVINGQLAQANLAQSACCGGSALMRLTQHIGPMAKAL